MSKVKIFREPHKKRHQMLLVASKYGGVGLGCLWFVGQIRTGCFTSPTFITFTAHYCSGLSAFRIPPFVCIKHKKPQRTKYQRQKFWSSGNAIKSFCIWIWSLCYIIHCLLHTFRYFHNARYILTAEDRSEAWGPPVGELQELFSPTSHPYSKLDSVRSEIFLNLTKSNPPHQIDFCHYFYWVCMTTLND